MSNADQVYGLDMLSRACDIAANKERQRIKDEIRKERLERTKETRRNAVETKTIPILAPSSKVCPHHPNRKPYHCKSCKNDRTAEIYAHKMTVKVVERAIREDQERASVAAQGEPKQQA